MKIHFLRWTWTPWPCRVRDIFFVTYLFSEMMSWSSPPHIGPRISSAIIFLNRDWICQLLNWDGTGKNVSFMPNSRGKLFESSCLHLLWNCICSSTTLIFFSRFSRIDSFWPRFVHCWLGLGFPLCLRVPLRSLDFGYKHVVKDDSSSCFVFCLHFWLWSDVFLLVLPIGNWQQSIAPLEKSNVEPKVMQVWKMMFLFKRLRFSGFMLIFGGVKNTSPI